MKRLGYVILAVVLIIVSYTVAGWNSRKSGAAHSVESTKTLLYYHCPMHPGFKSDKPGTAPCCGMELEPVYAGGETSDQETKPSLPPGTIHISAEKQQIVGVRTGVVERSSGARTIRLLGRVVADETRLYKIKAAADGWIQEVYPVTTGSFVKKGEPLASFYTPDYLTTAQYYVAALTNLDRRVLGTERSLQTYEDTLRGLGADDLQIDGIKKTRQIARSIVLSAPASGYVLLREVSEGLRFQKGEELYRIAELDKMWIYADLYENESRYVKPGAKAKVTHPHMGERFTARVSDVLPQFDATSRTLKVRLDVDNPRHILRPEMFVDVEFPLNFPASITVPAEAVLDTGVRKTVFVDLGDGVFEPRQVETGWRMDNRVEIVEGLTAGEKIVVSGNFLIDSESRLQGLASGYQATGEVDPVCGMTVDPAKAGDLKSEHGGKTYYFCNASCKESFDKDPQRYLSKSKGTQPPTMDHKAMPSKEAKHVDPVCGMTVDPAKAGNLKSEHDGKTYYFCNASCKESFDKDPHRYISKSKGAQPPAMDHKAMPAKVSTHEDPVCHMTVDPAKAGDLKSDYKGKTYYFCNPSCKEAFDKNPQGYLSTSKSAPPVMEHKAMAPKDGKRIDPVCGMTVDPTKAGVLKSEHQGTTYYFCNPFCKESFDREPGRYLAKGVLTPGTGQ